MDDERPTLYNKIVMDHFLNPRNMGKIEDPDGVGEVGSSACGDIMHIEIKVDKNTNIITDAKALTYGCGSAIATADMAIELMKGKTIEEASKITNKEVMDNLGGESWWRSNLPQKIHCSVLSQEAIQAAMDDYIKRHPEVKK